MLVKEVKNLLCESFTSMPTSIGQVCVGEKVGEIWTSLHNKFCHFMCVCIYNRVQPNECLWAETVQTCASSSPFVHTDPRSASA